MLLCLIFFSLLLLCGCGEKVGTDEVDLGETPDGVSAGLSAPRGFEFPHPENTADPNIHGIWVDESGTSLCLGCHRLDKDESVVAPFCRSCHSLYPHEENWDTKEKHGSYVIAGGKSECQTKCHNPDLTGGLSKTSCTSCHPTYPHSDNWSDPDVHGEEAKGSGKEACKSCHGGDFQGDEGVTGCFTCHENYPHDENWALKENHGALVLRDGKEICASSCHGVDLEGGNSEVMCKSCHGMFPHPDGWSAATSHGPAAIGDGKVICKSCHGDDFTGGASGVRCFNSDCHTNYPHADNWRDRDSHGSFVLNFGKGECDTECHGQDFAGGISNVACSNPSCHEYPHTDPNWVGGEDGPQHARTFRQKMIDQKSEDCTVCHGTNLDQPLGNGQCSNTLCHGSGFGHPSGTEIETWRTGDGHGRSLTAGGFRSNNEETACFTCHGRPVVFQVSHTDAAPDDPDRVLKEKLFLSSQSDCYRCHWSYPHIGWNVGWTTYNWEREAVCQQNDIGAAHFGGYVQQSPLMTDPTGRTVDYRDSNETRIAAIGHTCGREDGFCHFGGARSYGDLNFGGMCSGICHSHALPHSPVLPDCEPPAGEQLSAAPSVQEVTPLNGASDISRGLPSVRIQFSEPMRRETVLAPGTFYIQRDRGSFRLAAVVSCIGDWCTSARLRNFGTLDYNTQYSVHVTSAAQDWQGTALVPFTSTFTTIFTGPRVLSSNPTGTVYRNNPTINITFDRHVRCPVDSRCIVLKRTRDNHIYEGSTSCVTSRCTFTPSGVVTYYSDWEDGTFPEEYEVTATTAIQDLTGLNLANEYVWRFSVDYTAP